MFDGLDTSVQPIMVTPAHLPAWADRVRPHLAKMADGSGGRYETADILTAIASGRMLLWLAISGTDVLCAMLTEMVHYPRLRAMRCVGISGRRPGKWLHLLGVVERASAQHFGCAKMEAMHQPGHERLLKTGGWRHFHALAEKDIG